MSDNKTFFKKAKGGKLGFSDIFSDVFRRHTKEENSRLFLAGTPLTTPDAASMLSKWLKPYLFARIFLVGIVLIIAGIAMNLDLMVPFVFVAGSFLMPVVGMIFFWEMNIPRNISFTTVLLMFMVGGMLSLVFTTILGMFYLTDSAVALYVSVGIGEEVAKLLAAAVWLRKKDTKYVLSGMLVGAAVGAGFSALESAGYNIVRSGGWNFSQMLLRAMYAIGGHVSWAAITAGALVWVKKDEELSAKHLRNPVFLGALAFSAGTHALWDLYPGSALSPLLFVFNILIVWVAYMIMKRGVNQVVETSLRANEDRLTFALDHDFLEPLSGVAQARPRPSRPVSGGEMPGVAVRHGGGMPGVAVQSGGIRLQCVKGAFSGRRFALTGRVRIGRDPARNDLVFPSGTAGVSGVHCELLLQGGQIGIRDLGSSYGTFVNGNRLKPNQLCELRPGDRVNIGSAHEEFQITLKGGSI